MVGIPASRLLLIPFMNAITHTISLSGCTWGVESVRYRYPDRPCQENGRFPDKEAARPHNGHPGRGGSATSDRQGQVRSASQSKAAEVTVACLVKTRLRSISCASRSGSASNRRLPKSGSRGRRPGGGWRGQHRCHACVHKGFDGFRLQNSLEIGPAEGADTMLDNNRLTFDRRTAGWICVPGLPA